jgi:hypothetical protein
MWTLRKLSLKTSLCVLLLCNAGMGWAAQHQTTIENKHLSLVISTQDKRVRTTCIENRRAGQRLELAGDDFVLQFDDGSTIASNAMTLTGISKAKDGETQQSIVLELQGEGIELRYVTELHKEEWWASRWLEIRGAGKTLARVSLAHWQCQGASGPTEKGSVLPTLGYPSGCGQVVYAQDLFLAIAHAGAENFVTPQGISCSIPAYHSLSRDEWIKTPALVVGAGAAQDAWRDFIRYIDATRPVPARMFFMVNDWYWKDKSQPLQALKALADVKRQSGVPVDTFTLDDGWDFDWDEQTKIWGRLNRERFPGGWKALQAVGQAADIDISLWFGPIGGYTYRPKRIEFGRKIGFEIYGDKLCLSGTRYKQHVIESFAHWAGQGMDYIKVDGFWPECSVPDHGHPVGPAGAIAHMDSLMDVFAAWRKPRPELLIGYTCGVNPSPFWLQHADFLWRGGRDDSHAGQGTPFDRHNTYLDSILQAHRQTDMPMSAFVIFDIVQDRIAGADDQIFERGFWWLAARTSLHHDWYIQASDLTLKQWKLLARTALWAKQHEQAFRFSRMVGGDPAQGEVYGFSAFDGQRGTLALRNPSDRSQPIQSTLSELLLLPESLRDRTLRLHGVYGQTKALEGTHRASAPFGIDLPGLEISVFEVELD